MRWSVDSSTMEEDSACAVGRIHGLKARADLNGKAARAVKFIQSKGRWALVVDGGEKVLVKDENIDFSAFPVESVGDAVAADQQPCQSSECGGVACGVAVPTAEVIISTKADGEAATPAAALVAAPPPLPPVASFLQCFCLPFAPPPAIEALQQ